MATGIRHIFAGTVAISFLTACVIIVQMYLLSVIIAGVFMEGANLGLLNNNVILLGGTILLRSVLSWIREMNAQRGAIHIKSGLRNRLFSHLLDLGPAYIKREKTGELVSTAVEGIEKLDDYYTRYIPSAIAVLTIPVVIVVFVLYIDLLSGVVLMVTGPLIPFFMWLIGTYAEKITRRQWKTMSKMSSHFLDTLQGLKTLKLFGRSRDEAEEVRKTGESFRLVTMKVLKVAFLSGMVLELAASISIALVAVQIGIRLIEGMIPFQLGLFVLLLAPEFYLPFRTLGAHHHAGMEGAAAAERIFGILDLKSPHISSPGTAGLPDKPPAIRFENVSFIYPDGDLPALDEITCELPAGSLTAIVGHSGSGKTTFAYLLLRFLERSSGIITIDGVRLDDIAVTDWRSYAGFVPQHPRLFNGTIHQNLKFANPGAGFDEIVTAAQNAEAHDFITRLPDGYDTVLTDNAARLSGGEKQRIAIARAFIKNAPVIIMDEPTSNLDPESEEKIARAAARLASDKTAVVIAHRLNTVYRADRILVFDKSKIAEQGTHRDLLNRNGKYARYVEMYSGIQQTAEL